MAWNDFFKKPDSTPYTPFFQMPKVGDAIKDYAKQDVGAVAGVVNKADTLDNENFQSEVFKLAPGLREGLATLSNQAAEFVTGAVPEDVRQKVEANRAYKSFSSGINARGEQAAGLQAKDFGLTSLDMIGLGNQYLGSSAQIGESLNPFRTSTTSQLLSTQYLDQRNIMGAQQTYNTMLQNMNTQYLNGQRKTGFDQLLSQTVASVAGIPFQFLQSASNVIGNSPELAASFFMSAYGGSGDTSATNKGTTGGWNSAASTQAPYQAGQYLSAQPTMQMAPASAGSYGNYGNFYDSYGTSGLGATGGMSNMSGQYGSFTSPGGGGSISSFMPAGLGGF